MVDAVPVFADNPRATVLPCVRLVIAWPEPKCQGGIRDRCWQKDLRKWVRDLVKCHWQLVRMTLCQKRCAEYLTICMVGLQCTWFKVLQKKKVGRMRLILSYFALGGSQTS